MELNAKEHVTSTKKDGAVYFRTRGWKMFFIVAGLFPSLLFLPLLVFVSVFAMLLTGSRVFPWSQALAAPSSQSAMLSGLSAWP